MLTRRLKGRQTRDPQSVAGYVRHRQRISRGRSRGQPTFKSATYNDKFKQRFLEAQADRNADLLQEAQNIWSDINAGKREVYPDDMPFVVPGSDGAARLWQADTSLVNCRKNLKFF